MIAREEARVDAALAPLRERLDGKRVLIFTGGYKSWSVVSAMQDLGMVVVATGTEKSTEEDKARIGELMGPDARMISDNDQTALIARLPRMRGRHPDRRRPLHLSDAEIAHSLPRHRSRPPHRLRRL